MEANSGTDQKTHMRRHADSTVSGGLRNLHWEEQATDLSLLPQSPLSIQQALTSSGARISLLSLDDHHRHTTAEGKSAQLRTNYDTITLRQKCRQLVVESALVKRKDEKRLYIAAGFLHWQCEPNAPLRQSALLFYPVRLITEKPESGEGLVHLLLNEDGVPEYNHHLHAQFRQINSIELPHFNPRQSLSYFIAQVELAVRELPEASVDYRVQLGLAAAPAGIDPQSHHHLPRLEKLPAQFRLSLARQLIDNLELEELQTTLKLLSASNDFSFSSNGDTDAADAEPDIARVREFSMLLAQYGLGHIDFKLLPELPGRISNWVSDIEPALNSELIADTMSEHDISAVQLMKLSGILELIDKAPDNIDALLHRDLAYRGTHLLFRRARHQAQLIYDELAQLQRHFHMDRIPAKSQLLQLIEELGGQPEHGIDVVDSDYFNARRQFMDFSTNKPATLSEEHKRLLNKLVKVLRFRELFVNNTEYRLALGPAYRGLKTDWDKLEKVLNYAQELRQVLGSAAIAATALENWPSFRTAYTRSLPRLLSANNAIRSLLKVIRSSDQKTSSRELLIKAAFLADQLRNWNMDYGLFNTYGDSNANSLLHLFSGKAGLDTRSEDLVRDANNHIHNFLLNNQQQPALQQITETIAWLNSAVNTRSVSISDIRREMEQAEDN